MCTKKQTQYGYDNSDFLANLELKWLPAETRTRHGATNTSGVSTTHNTAVARYTHAHSHTHTRARAHTQTHIHTRIYGGIMLYRLNTSERTVESIYQ